MDLNPYAEKTSNRGPGIKPMQRNYARSVFAGPTILVVVIGIFLIPSRLVAQGDGTGIDATGADDAAGASNPTGPSGIFNGNVTTAGSYDPSTGNAMRVVDDIVVPGCVGAYPLKWTRYYNSRQTQYYNSYGTSKVPASSGAWTFAYDYGYGIGNLGHQNVMMFPDGRTIDLNATVPPTGLAEHIGYWVGQLAIFLGDGGKVTFMTYDRTWHYLDIYGHWASAIATEYLPDQIIDPYGKITTISYEDVTDNSNSYHDSFKRRSQIKEPGGRYLKLTYGNVLRLNPQDPYDTRINEFTVDQFIVKVEAFDGMPGNPAIQSVTYTYQNNWNLQGNTYNFAVLTKATYSDGAAASYTYQNGHFHSLLRPIIETCDDPRYGGPMRQIQYNFDNNGVIISEQKPNGSIVSTIAGVTNGKIAHDTALTQTETRGDLSTPTRKFTYFYAGANSDETDTDLYKIGKLLDYTDFAQHHTILDYDNTPGPGNTRGPALGFLKSVTDANQNKTVYTRSSTSWGINTITHYAPNGTEVDHISQTFTDDANPYYLHDRTDERGNTTTYHRDDPNNANAITEIDYPSDSQTPASFETFEYNARGQVTKHRLKNGAYQHFQYDSRWLLVAKWSPTTNSTAVGYDPKTTYTYYPDGDSQYNSWTDRVKTETDPRGNTTTFEYDYGFDTSGNSTSTRAAGRGLVTKIIHPDNTYQSFGYNQYGDKLWEENEKREPTTYTYDNYGRLLTIVNPLSKPVLTNTYTPSNNTALSPYTHTTNSVYTATTATGIVATNLYDSNFRKTSTQVGTSTTHFVYDQYASIASIGNLVAVTDPNGHTTTTDYDSRNRKWHVWDALGHQTTFGYDPASNVITITRPDLSVEIKTYDALNRVKTDTVPKDGPATSPTEFITTSFVYNPSGSLYSVTDGKNQTTTFEYDPSDLKTKMTYPNGTDYQSWTYDPAKNLIARRTVNGVSQLFSYDSRNRQFAMAWSDGADWANFAYDDASRMISAENPTSTITRTYDAAGHLTLDRQRLRILPLTAVSRKTHNTYPTPMPFDVALPLVGTAGIECRTGGATNDHQMVVTFPRAVTFTGASFTSGTGTVASTSTSTDGKMVTINLTGVTNAQTITVTLNGVNDGITTNDVNIGMGVLWGDTTGNGFVNSADVSQVQAQSGWPVTSSNFREDVTANGFINSGDVGVVQWQSGHSLPYAFPLTQPVPSSPDIDVRYDYFDDGTEKQLFVTQNGAPTGYDLTYGYDEQRRFKTISNTNGATLFTYTYDAASNEVDRLNNTTGVDQSYGTPDPLNRMTQRDVKSNTGAMLSHEAYGYDPQRPGLLTTVTRQEQSQTQTQDFFAYDLTGEVTNAQYAVPSGGSAVRTCGYVWDKAGNRASVTDNGLFISYNTTGNVLNQYWNVGTDAVGNGTEHELASYQNINYTYINDTHLSSVSGMDINGGQSTYQLSYDALGRCAVRVLNGSVSYYIYDGEKPILEYHSWSGPSAANIYGRGIDEILQRTDYTANPARTLYYQDDHEGSVTHLTDGTGAVLESYRYDAFGKPTINGGALTAPAFGNRFMFTGREYVPTFGVYEYRNRAYHPGLGRFMSEDPKGFAAGDNNFFRYCGNDPVDRVDPMGLSDAILKAQYDPNYIGGAGSGQFDKMQSMGAAQVGARLQAHTVEMKQTEAWGAAHSESQNQSMGQQRPSNNAVERRGTLTIDTDGGNTTNTYGDPHHSSRTAGVLAASGRIIPSGHGGTPLNANSNPYVVAPSKLRTTRGGSLRPGDWAAVMVRGHTEWMQIGDFSHKKTIEVSIAAARQLGADVISGREGPVPTFNGRVASPIPATVIYYPGSGE